MAIRRILRAGRVMGRRKARQAVRKVASAGRRAYAKASPSVKKAGYRVRGAAYSGARRAKAAGARAYGYAKPRVKAAGRRVGAGARRAGAHIKKNRGIYAAGAGVGVATGGAYYVGSRNRKKKKTRRRRRH